MSLGPFVLSSAPWPVSQCPLAQSVGELVSRVFAGLSGWQCGVGFRTLSAAGGVFSIVTSEW